jgi:hypothetical protein
MYVYIIKREREREREEGKRGKFFALQRMKPNSGPRPK